MPAVTTSIPGPVIAAAAKKYDGQGYVYGGNASRPGDWDCSSFASYVLGHDLGMGLPGGRWGGPGMPPAVHGPVVLSYVTWGGADPVPAGQQQAGDLVCWAGVGTGGHMGFVLGTDQMVSALDTAQGTLITPIQGYGPTGTPVYRRIRGSGTAPGGAGTTAAQGWLDMLLPMAAGLAAGTGAILLVLGAAVVAAFGVTWVAWHTVRAVT